MSTRPPGRGSTVRPRRPADENARRTATIFGVLVGIATVVVLFPWYPGSRTPEVGTTATRNVVAPRDISYESVVLTEQVREAAANAVAEVFVLDTGIRARQLGELERLVGEIARARRTTLSASARESEIRAVTSPPMSPEAAEVFASASDTEWGALADEARSALGRTLTGAINEDDVDQARERASTFLSPLLDAAQADAVSELIEPLVVQTLVVDEERTAILRADARANQPPVRVTYGRGELVVQQGEQFSAADLEALERLDLIRSGVRPSDIAATVVIGALVGGAMGGYVGVAQPRALRGMRRLTLFALLFLVPVAAAKFTLPLISPDVQRHFLAHAIPLMAGPMAAAVLLELGAAILLAMLLAGVVGVISIALPGIDAGGGAGQLETARLALGVGAGALAGVLLAARADRLQRFLVAGLGAGAASAVAALLVWLLDPDRGVLDLAWLVGASATGGILSALIAVGAFVLLSRPFGIITRIELMELAQMSHPLLRRLQDEAPGTFQHVMLVGNLASRGADLVGADPLLARVGAYYHDVGKLVAPTFFVENLSSGEESPHDSLDPLQSTRVIHQHVTAGVELARREGLPEAVVQFVAQHHGTRLMTFFYRKAAQMDPDIDPELFRYPGPKPQSRESAIVMLADSCEATVRAQSDRSPERIRQLVEGTIRERIEEGQFDESDISMRDLRIIADAFSSTLASVFHSRVEYPAPTARELAERRGADVEDVRDAREERRRRRRRAETPDGGASRREVADDATEPPEVPPTRRQPARTGADELNEDQS